MVNKSWIGVITALAFLVGGRATETQDEVWRKDFEFVVDAVAKNGAAVVRHEIDWKDVAAAYRARLAAVRDQVGFITLITELLAECRDSHTDLVRHDVDGKSLPSKWDGLWSAGLWLVEDEGRFHVAAADGADAPPPGSTMAAIEDWPWHLAMERELRRASRSHGVSSRHSFFASIGNRCVPLRDLEVANLTFIADGKVKQAKVRRWGPSGKGIDWFVHTAPEGLPRAEVVAAKVLVEEGDLRIGYLRITGSMNEPTAAAFHAAMDGLATTSALVLDCRGMGGGSDHSAWNMAGRFFAKPVDNGRNGRIEPSGSSPYTRPVILLQDALEVSSAETFTWAMSETKRVLSIGRPTGGWSIIPQRFEAPSGRFAFRLGVTDRATPIQGLKTEGIGWAPDLLLPMGPVASARPRLGLEVATAAAVVAATHGEAAARRLFVDLLGARDAAAFEKQARAVKLPKSAADASTLVDVFASDDLATLAAEADLLDMDLPPDCVGAARRLEGLRGLENAKSKAAVAALTKRLKSLAKEEKAQRDLLDALDRDFTWSKGDRATYLKKHRGTKYAAFAERALAARP